MVQITPDTELSLVQINPDTQLSLVDLCYACAITTQGVHGQKNLYMTLIIFNDPVVAEWALTVRESEGGWRIMVGLTPALSCHNDTVRDTKCLL